MVVSPTTTTAVLETSEIVREWICQSAQMDIQGKWYAVRLISTECKIVWYITMSDRNFNILKRKQRFAKIF